ncbi:uncharacterized protein RAG0_00226 [Rhynchosporium agropyri]|uniref:Uncharacterized protein n=1 Tax=Rhynchosporium agropyri TaxID=914238 RepID=A0A1E1JRT1_9HELO|nr:uncharacterized protein RAG0_00226 [Rhynchosporium agropyri]
MKYLALTLSTVLTLATALSLPAETNENPADILRKRQQNGFQVHSCAIVGSGNAKCRKCAHSNCDNFKTLTHGKKYDFNCVCRGGECVNGLCGWDYALDLNCWVWAGRTDGNCPTAGKNGLTECDFCTR